MSALLALSLLLSQPALAAGWDDYCGPAIAQGAAACGIFGLQDGARWGGRGTPFTIKNPTQLLTDMRANVSTTSAMEFGSEGYFEKYMFRTKVDPESMGSQFASYPNWAWSGRRGDRFCVTLLTDSTVVVVIAGSDANAVSGAYQVASLLKAVGQ